MLKALLLLAAVAGAHTGDGGDHKHTVKEPSIWINLRFGMPEQMETQLETWDKNFSIIALSQLDADIRQAYAFTMSQAPSVVIADFNGDKVKDTALLGWSNGHLRLIAIVSKPGGYQIAEIKTWRMDYPQGPTLKRRIALSAEPVGIHLLVDNDPPLLFQWRGGTFQET